MHRSRGTGEECDFLAQRLRVAGARCDDHEGRRGLGRRLSDGQGRGGAVQSSPLDGRWRGRWEERGRIGASFGQKTTKKCPPRTRRGELGDSANLRDLAGSGGCGCVTGQRPQHRRRAGRPAPVRSVRWRPRVDHVITLEVDHETGILPARNRRLADGGDLGDRVAEFTGDLGHGHAARRGGDIGIP